MIATDASWTLFLDRDGVLNRRLPGAYVRHWEEFEWLPGVLNAWQLLSRHFGRIIIVTNQQGIGKGLMTDQELNAVHQQMKKEVGQAGGRIDQIYYCADLASKTNNCRKPAPAMAWKAKADFPEIDFSRSVMVGDSISDMAFGQRLGMYNVLITTKQEESQGLLASEGLQIDVRYPSLAAWTKEHLGFGKQNI
jgi:histidinol-phosphate phosphatase family protein